jgi:DNA ligase-1
MRLDDVVQASADVAATRSRLAKRARLAALLRGLAPDERAPVVAWLCGEVLQGKLGVGWAMLRDADQAAAPEPSLTVGEVDAAFGALERVSGGGATRERRRLLGALFARATEAERAFVRRVLLGELRQGGLDGIMAEAVAEAATLPADEVRRAWMLAGSLPRVAAAALEAGRDGLARFSLTPFRAVLPMLAAPAEDPDEALAELGEARLEWKLDGVRVQVHRDGGEVRVFSRGLQDVTASVPEVVELARALPGGALILDGEAIALRPDGSPRPFQETQSRFARRLDVATARGAVPLTPFLFDALLLDGEPIVDRPLGARVAALEPLLPLASRVPATIAATAADAARFLDEALARGHEGAMAKALGAAYQAGARGKSWLKLKRAHTLDLVVLAAEWGSGRRVGFLSNLHLGARDPAHGGFVMLGKTFKGMTDVILAWQTARLQALALGREGHVVHVRPELVVEIAFDEVQASPHYPGGMALRFARLKRYREDKRADEADTIDTVRAIYLRERGAADEG